MYNFETILNSVVKINEKIALIQTHIETNLRGYKHINLDFSEVEIYIEEGDTSEYPQLDGQSSAIFNAFWFEQYTKFCAKVTELGLKYNKFASGIRIVTPVVFKCNNDSSCGVDWSATTVKLLNQYEEHSDLNWMVQKGLIVFNPKVQRNFPIKEENWEAYKARQYDKRAKLLEEIESDLWNTYKNNYIMGVEQVVAYLEEVEEKQLEVFQEFCKNWKGEVDGE